jgi:hypothetical protein
MDVAEVDVPHSLVWDEKTVFWSSPKELFHIVSVPPTTHGYTPQYGTALRVMTKRLFSVPDQRIDKND